MNRSASRPSRYDFVVVGAGSAGCVLANRLSTAGRVLLLEAGGHDRLLSVRIPAAFWKLFKTERDWDFTSGPEPGAAGRMLFVPCGRMVGGSSSMNAMIYVRGRPSDYDRWADLGATGWNWQAVRPWFLEVEDNVRGPDPHHGVGGEMRERTSAILLPSPAGSSKRPSKPVSHPTPTSTATVKKVWACSR